MGQVHRIANNRTAGSCLRDQSDFSDEVYEALLGHRRWYESDETFVFISDGFNCDSNLRAG